MTVLSRVAAAASALALFASASAALAQQEFPPPQGKGRVVVLSSGMSGPAHYADVARDIALLGYDVVMVDGNSEEGTHGAAVRTAIQEALTMPHALPGKVALVGFSLGGGESLYYGTQWSDLVAGVVVWYPANSFIRNVPGFAGRLQVPVVVLAGGKDNYRNGCCTAAYDTTLQAAAQAAGKSFELTVYPDADHDFVKGGANYNAKDYEDGLKRTADALKTYFST
ncbi:MAG TPA: dienelactone hydrolase family protein [Magnetospirillaceae bacterium]|nr:dienelactone hydrolase family protein [Magnetospirillaceae bacterium]